MTREEEASAQIAPGAMLAIRVLVHESMNEIRSPLDEQAFEKRLYQDAYDAPRPGAPAKITTEQCCQIAALA